MRSFFFPLFCLCVLVACGPNQPDTPAIITATPAPTQTLERSPTPTPLPTDSPIQQTAVAFVGWPTASPSPTPPPSLTPLPSPTAPQFGVLPNLPAPNRIIFSSDRAGSADLWLMNLDGGDAQALVILPDSEESGATCSPDGSQFVFESIRGGDRELYLGGYAGEAIRPITDTAGENFAAAWSPLGDLIVFVSTRDGQSDLWIMDGGGGNLLRLMDDPAEEIMPAWSPDAEKIYFASNRAGNYDLYAFDIPTTQTLQISDSAAVDEFWPAPGFGPDEVMYAASDGAKMALWEGETLLLGAYGDVTHPAWLAAGHLLYAAAIGEGVTAIFAANLPEQRLTQLSNLGLQNTHPRPCYVARLSAASTLPVGQPPTPTATPITQPADDYIAIVNPSGDWVALEVEWGREQLAALGGQDERLAAVELSDGALAFTWQAEGATHRLSIAIERLGGALVVTPLSYTIDDRPQSLTAVVGLTETLRLALLHGSLPAGYYRLERAIIEPSALRLAFLIPPD